MVDEMGFAGNVDNYYDVRNSSFDHVLKSRKGIPMTLAVIYKCILHRVGVYVDMIGLPGHVVLGIPGGDAFVDVFNGGRTLSLDDCRDIVQSYGIEWRPDFTRPLEPKHVIIRMFNNIENCLARALRQSRTTRAYSSMVRTVAFRTLMQYFNPEGSQFQISQNPCAFMDPAIFRHYNLINGDTMRRHTEAPFFQFQAEE
jgi:regulator of sirC expression with transglutaminase-like and TPR domain